MEVLAGSRWPNIRHGNELQERRRRRTDTTGRDEVCRPARLADRWINRRTDIRNKNLDGLAIIVFRSRKIAA